MTSQDEQRDARQWEAVEEAIELLVEGEHQSGLEHLRDVLEADSQNSYAFHFLGTGLFELKRFEPARDAYQAALLLSPNYLGARVGLSHTLRLLGDRRAAAWQAREALRRFPDDAGALHAAGLALAAEGERGEAMEMLERFLTERPELEAQLDVAGMLDLLRKAKDGEPVDFE